MPQHPEPHIRRAPRDARRTSQAAINVSATGTERDVLEMRHSMLIATTEQFLGYLAVTLRTPLMRLVCLGCPP